MVSNSFIKQIRDRLTPSTTQLQRDLMTALRNYAFQFNQNSHLVNNLGLQALINERALPPYNQDNALPYEPNPPPYDNTPVNPPPYQEHDWSNGGMANNSSDSIV